MKILRSKKGVTLMEVIVASLMFAIVAIAATTAMAPMLRFQMRANDIAEVNSIFDNVANVIIRDLSSASDVINYGTDDILEVSIPTLGDIELSIAPDPANNNLLALLRNGVSVLPAGYFRNNAVSFNVTEPSTGVFNVRISVTDITGMTERNFVVRPLMMI